MIGRVIKIGSIRENGMVWKGICMGILSNEEDLFGLKLGEINERI